MVSTLMHIIYGTMVALILKLNLPLFLIFTNLPDLDGIIDVLNNKFKYHRYILHNIFAFFLILILGLIFFNFKLVFIALTFHLFLDFLDTKIPFFYPSSKKLYGFNLLKKKKTSLWTLIFYEQNIFFTIISLIIFIIFLLFYFF